MNKRPAILVGVFMVILIALAWMLQSQDDAENRNSRTSKASSKTNATAAETTTAQTHRERRGASPTSRPDSSRTHHDAAKLVNFILPKLEGKDVTIQQALVMIEEAYQDACFTSREKPLDLKFSVHDDPGHVISFSLKGKSFVACLDYVAALAGLKVERSECEFALGPHPDEVNTRELILTVNSGTETRLREMCGADPAEGNGEIETALRKAGIIREAETSLGIGPDGVWSIKGPVADRERITHAMLLAKDPPNQLKFTTRTITTDEPLDLKNTNLSPVESAELVRELASRAGTELATEPSVVAHEGQSATVELIRETTDGNQTDWTGVKHELSGRYTGLKLVGSDKTEKRAEHADDSAWLSDNQFALYPGNTRVQLVSSRNGKYVYRLLTAISIDATGRPLTSGGARRSRG